MTHQHQRTCLGRRTKVWVGLQMCVAVLGLTALPTRAEPVLQTGPIETRAGTALVITEPETQTQLLQVGDTVLFGGGAVRYVWLEAQLGDLLLVGVSNGGTGCPALFTWVHAEPQAVRAVEPYFGTCYDAVETNHDAQTVSVVMRSDTPSEGWVAFRYDGDQVVREQLGQRPSGAPPEAERQAWIGRYPYEMMRASDWRDLLIQVLGPEAYEVLGTFTTQATPFAQQGQWVVGWGCNRRFCGGQEAVIALHVITNAVVIAIKDRDTPPVVFGGAEVYPPAITEFLARWSDE